MDLAEIYIRYYEKIDVIDIVRDGKIIVPIRLERFKELIENPENVTVEELWEESKIIIFDEWVYPNAEIKKEIMRRLEE